jgi:hypothetical protein
MRELRQDPRAEVVMEEAVDMWEAGARSGATQDRSAFDTWLNRELSRAYDGLLQEPVPEDLLHLIGPATEED